MVRERRCWNKVNHRPRAICEGPKGVAIAGPRSEHEAIVPKRLNRCGREGKRNAVDLLMGCWIKGEEQVIASVGHVEDVHAGGVAGIFDRNGIARSPQAMPG